MQFITMYGTQKFDTVLSRIAEPIQTPKDALNVLVNGARRLKFSADGAEYVVSLLDAIQKRDEKITNLGADIKYYRATAGEASALLEQIYE